ncbi:MAG: hypothetical protein HC902_00655 [Calothrix sp. SM1_5_4]|nr:hypothetical protein [Calothrix sp. SM1_5_4]
MKQIFPLLAALMVVAAISGCRTSPPLKVSDASEGQWRGKALIKDKEQNRSYFVYINFNAVRDRKARMDVTSALGTGVASLLDRWRGGALRAFRL